MSDQPPLTPPSGGGPTQPAYPAYDAPAWGNTRPEPTVTPAPLPYGVPAQYVGSYGAPTHPLAVTSLVLGILGLVSLFLVPLLIVTIVGVVCSPIAIWLGIWARRQIRADPRRYAGDGVALGGLVTGIVGTVLGLVAVALIAALIALFASSLNGF